MYKEDLILLAKETEDVEERKRLMEESFYANYGLTVQMLKHYGMNKDNCDDLLQLAYLAFDKTVKVYKPESGYSIMSYYRLCLKHECYVFWSKEGKLKSLHEEIGNAEFEKFVGYKELEAMYEYIELKNVNEGLWRRIDSVLGAYDANILEERFKKEMTLSKIGLDCGLTCEGVRRRILRACNKLHNDKVVCDIARYYHYI